MIARRGRVVDYENSVQSGGHVGEWQEELGHPKGCCLRAPVTNWTAGRTSRSTCMRAFRRLTCSFESPGLPHGDSLQNPSFSATIQPTNYAPSFPSSRIWLSYRGLSTHVHSLLFEQAVQPMWRLQLPLGSGPILR